MGKCEYKFINPITKEIEYECLHTALKGYDYGGKKHCIFHTEQSNKDLKEFYQGFKKLYEDDKHDFTGFIFPKGFDFRKLKEDTGDLEFKDADFERAIFSGTANFVEAAFTGWTYFRRAKFSGVADFGGATFSGEASFEGVTFSERANFIFATFSGESDFRRAKFSGVSNFGGATFSERAYFGGATFSGEANFWDAIFSGWVDFFEVKFTGMACFGGATLSGRVNFVQSTFSGFTDFEGATLSGRAYFLRTTFLEETFFMNATFSEKSKVIFEGKTFKDSAIAYFQNLNIEDGADLTFDKVNLNRARFLETDLEKINFKEVYWRNQKEYLEEYEKKKEKISDLIKQYLKKDIKAVHKEIKLRIEEIFSRIMLYDEVLQRGFDRKNKEGEENHYKVQQLYNQLSINYEKSGRYHEAGDFFVGAMEMRRKGKREKRIIRKVLRLYKFISLYGERPFRAFMLILSFWILFGLLFSLVGFESIENSCGNIGHGLIKSLDTLALGKIAPEYDLKNPDCGYIIQGIQIAVNAVLIPLFILAMNRKFRRTKD